MLPIAITGLMVVRRGRVVMVACWWVVTAVVALEVGCTALDEPWNARGFVFM